MLISNFVIKISMGVCLYLYHACSELTQNDKLLVYFVQYIDKMIYLVNYIMYLNKKLSEILKTEIN